MTSRQGMNHKLSPDEEGEKRPRALGKTRERKAVEGGKTTLLRPVIEVNPPDPNTRRRKEVQKKGKSLLL